MSNTPQQRICTSSLLQFWLLELLCSSVISLGCKHRFLETIMTVYLTKSCSQKVFQMRPVPAEHIFIPMSFGIALLRFVGLLLFTDACFDCILSLASTKRGSSWLGNTLKASSPSSHGNLITWVSENLVVIFYPHLLRNCFHQRLRPFLHF